MTKIKLLSCPHCGGEAELRESAAYNARAYRVQCPSCHIGTVPVSVGYYTQFDGRIGVTITPERAQRYVIERWNRRVQGNVNATT